MFEPKTLYRHSLFHNFGTFSVSSPLMCLMPTSITNLVLLSSTLLCKKIARVPVGRKRYMSSKIGGGGGVNRSDFY